MSKSCSRRWISSHGKSTTAAKRTKSYAATIYKSVRTTQSLYPARRCLHNIDIKIAISFLNRYNKLSREVRELCERIARLDGTDPFKGEATAMLMNKLHALGVANDHITLETASKMSASNFCRRRLPVVMVRREHRFRFMLLLDLNLSIMFFQ